MQPDNDDDAWRAIVDNFGDRAELPPDPEPSPAARPVEGVDFPLLSDAFGPEPAAFVEEDETFVPPPPPPLPVVPRDRMLAWIGLFGSPTLLLLSLILGIHLPGLVGWGLVLGFLGGFGYLVLTMPREPRDPFDDGARL